MANRTIGTLTSVVTGIAGTPPAFSVAVTTVTTATIVAATCDAGVMPNDRSL
ncbi:MAG: hypothetical protein H7173_10035 [Rhodoferax sp.]|nr:hypothetical protein [Pseudorhodobacter sp.]